MSNEGLLFKVNPSTGQATEIEIDGDLVFNGDGLELRGRTLYVVRNFDNLVEVLTLSAGLTQAEEIGKIGPSGFVLDVPTTGTLSLGALWVVNARFLTPPEPDTEYWITRLPTRP